MHLFSANTPFVGRMFLVAECPLDGAKSLIPAEMAARMIGILISTARRLRKSTTRVRGKENAQRETNPTIPGLEVTVTATSRVLACTGGWER
jgi:hypothetical protein